MNRRYGKIDIAYNISLDSNMPLLSLSERFFGQWLYPPVHSVGWVYYIRRGREQREALYRCGQTKPKWRCDSDLFIMSATEVNLQCYNVTVLIN